MLPTAAQVRKADEYMAQASEKTNAKSQFIVYGRAWKLLKHLDDPAYYARQRDCLTKLITICRQITSWDDAERDAVIAKYQTALDKLPPLLSPEEKALLTKVRCLIEEGMTSHHDADSQFFAYQQAWKQLKKQEAPALIPTMRDCLEKLIAVCHQMTDWADTERNAAIQKYQTILAGLSESASTPLANTTVNQIPSIATPAGSVDEPVEIGPASLSAAPELTPKITALFSVVPFANTEKLVQAYQLQKHRCLQHPEDELAKQHLHDIEDIIQDNIIAHEMTLSESSLKQSVILLGAGLSNKTMQLLIKQLFKLIADNPLDFLDESAVTKLGLMKAEDKLTETQLRQITSLLVKQMQGLHAPDIAMMCLVLNTLYQTLAAMISKQVIHVSQALHLAPIKAALHNLKHRLQAIDTQTEDKVAQCQWIDIGATVEYALESLTHFTAEEMPWQQRAHYARITGTLLLQAAGIGDAVIGAVSDPDASIGSAINAAVGLLQHLWRHAGTIYRYCHCNQPYFTALKKWQAHFIGEVLPQYSLWDNALMSLRLPIEDNDKSRLWLKNSNAQVGVMRTLMAVYDMPIQGIEMPATKATLQKKTVQLLINYYQQSINQPEASHQLVRLTAAQYLLSLQPQLSTLQTELINTLITLADRKLLKMSEVTQTIADEPRVITIDSPTNIALQGWRQRYPDDEALYRLLRSYPTLPAEEKGGFLQCMQEFVKDGSTKQLSYWGREVIAALGEELTSAIRRLPTCSDPAGPVKLTFAGIMAAARGKIIAHKEGIDEAKRIKMAMLREHLGLLSDMATKHGLFERWESQMDKWRIGELIAAGVIEATVAPIISPHEVDVEILSGQAETAVLAASTMETQPLVVHRSDTVSRGAGAAAAAPHPFASYSQVDNSTIFIFGHLSVDPQFPIDTLLDKLAALLRSSRQGLSLELMQLAERFSASGTSERALYCYAAAYCVHLQDQSPCPPTLVPCIERLLNTLADTGFATDAGLRCMQKPNNVEGETWLHYFITTYPAPHLIDYLLNQQQYRWQLQAHYRGKTPLMLAIQSGDDALCRQLLAHGATTAGCDGAGNTCLHLACQQGFSKVIPDLLAATKPLSMEVVGPLNTAGDTVLHALCVSGCHEWGCYEDILRYFPSAVNQRNLAGYFPLQLAACHAPLEIFTELQAKTTVVLSAGEDGKTCLHLAAEFGNAAIVRLLATQGEVNALDRAQCTPLHLAARVRQLGHGHNVDDYRQVFIALLQHGADETLTNGQGQTVRDMVLQCQEIQAVFEQVWAQLAPQRLLQRWQTQCAAYYTQPSFVKKRLFDTDYFSLADYFVNLQLVKEVKRSASASTTNQNKPLIRPLRERDRDLEGKKTAIALSDIFKPAQYQDTQDMLPGAVNTVVVSGAAGVGKTTLSDYIAYQWALAQQEQGISGLWSDFDAVLIIHCRSLHPETLGPDIQEWDIVQLLRRACWGELELSIAEAKQILSRLREKPANCLLMIEGLDELPTFARGSAWYKLLVQLFRLPFKKLVTTRPYAIANLQQWLRYDGLIEIQGFSEKDVSVFFKHNLKDTEEPALLIEKLKQNKDLWSIAHIPINAYLLKSWWQTSCRHKRQVELTQLSVSELYLSLIVNVCRRYLERDGCLDENALLDDVIILKDPVINLLLQTLGCWAFEGLRQDTTQLSIRWLKGIESAEENPTLLAENRLPFIKVQYLKTLGLLKKIGKEINNQQSYEFLHLSFQEFLAAWVIKDYLSCGTEAQKLSVGKVIKAYKYHPNFTLVWPFVAGLLKPYPDAQETFFQLLLQAPRDWVGVAEEDLFIRCLEASLSLDNSIELLEGKQQSLMRFIDQRLKKLHAMPDKLQERFQDILKPCYQIQRCLFDSIATLLVDNKVKKSVRVSFAWSLGAYISQDFDKMDTVLALIKNEDLDESVRYALVCNFAKCLSLDSGKLDTALALMKDEGVNMDTRVAFASKLAAQILQCSSKLLDEILLLIKNEQVSRRVRYQLVDDFIKRIFQDSDKLDVVLALIKNEQVNRKTRIMCARSLAQHIPQDSDKVDTMLTLIKNDEVNEAVRITIACVLVRRILGKNQVFLSLKKEKVAEKSRVAFAWDVVMHISENSKKIDAVFSLIRDRVLDTNDSIALAFSLVTYLSQNSNTVDAVWILLANEQESQRARLTLAHGLVKHILQDSDKMDIHVVFSFLEKEAVKENIRIVLARGLAAHISRIFEMDAILVFLENEALNKNVRAALASRLVLDNLQASDKMGVVLAFLENQTVNKDVRAALANCLALDKFQASDKLNAVLALFENEAVNKDIRIALAKNLAKYLYQHCEKQDIVWMLLKDEGVNENVRSKLAYHFVSHISSDFEKVDAVCKLLANDKMNGKVRIKIALGLVDSISQARYTSLDYDKVDAIWALLIDKKTDKYVFSCIRIRLAYELIRRMPMSSDKLDVILNFLTNQKVNEYIHDNFDIEEAHFDFYSIRSYLLDLLDIVDNLSANILPGCEKKVDTILALLENEQVNEHVRVAFARGLIMHRSGVYRKMSTSKKLLNRQVKKEIRATLANKMDKVLALIKNRKVEKEIRVLLARNLVLCVSQDSDKMDTVLALLDNEEENKEVRITIALGLVMHTTQYFIKINAMLRLLAYEDMTVSDRAQLARRLVPHLSKWPEKIKLFLKGILLKSHHDNVDISSDIDIPAYLIVPIYEQTDAKGRRYIIKQLLKNNVVLVEQQDKIMVIEAGQVNSLSLASSAIKRIKQDLFDEYDVGIDHSASLLPEYSLISNSQAANLSSSQDCEVIIESSSEIGTNGAGFHNAGCPKQAH